jgi:hypothetical protein
MKHSVEALFSASYKYYPRGEPFPATGAKATPEYRNRQEAHDRASAGYPKWKAMLQRIADRFPEQQYPGAGIEDRCVFLQAPGMTPWGRCFAGSLWFPSEMRPVERRVGFQVSFVVPYYMVYIWHDLPAHKWISDQFSFEPSAEERPFIQAVKEEIETTYSGHELMPHWVGMTPVPDIVECGSGPGNRATIYDCLFSDAW